MDRENFNELLKAQKDRIYSYAYYFLRNPQDAEDVTQEVFLRLWRRCRAPNQQGRVAWMMRVTHNLCIDIKRKQKRHRDRLLNLEQHTLAPFPHHQQGRADPERDLQLNEIQKILLDAMNQLPLGTRSIMLMHYFEGLTLQEIGKILDAKVNTVKVKAHRGRRALRRILAEKLSETESRQGTA
jgi:RNA polymerase sigma-70 factor (ECF subfamily)